VCVFTYIDKGVRVGPYTYGFSLARVGVDGVRSKGYVRARRELVMNVPGSGSGDVRVVDDEALEAARKAGVETMHRFAGSLGDETPRFVWGVATLEELARVIAASAVEAYMNDLLRQLSDGCEQC
jgi:hypothetical protein